MLSTYYDDDAAVRFASGIDGPRGPLPFALVMLSLAKPTRNDTHTPSVHEQLAAASLCTAGAAWTQPCPRRAMYCCPPVGRPAVKAQLLVDLYPASAPDLDVILLFLSSIIVLCFCLLLHVHTCCVVA